MSTSALYGIVFENEEVMFNYIDCDGYPSQSGLILHEHYSDPDKVLQTLGLGSIYALRELIGEKHDAESPGGYDLACNNRWTSFFGRDRNYQDFEPSYILSFKEFIATAVNSHVKFVYLFSMVDKQWRAAYVKTLIQRIAKDTEDITHLTDLPKFDFDFCIESTNEFISQGYRDQYYNVFEKYFKNKKHPYSVFEEFLKEGK